MRTPQFGGIVQYHFTYRGNAFTPMQNSVMAQMLSHRHHQQNLADATMEAHPDIELMQAPQRYSDGNFYSVTNDEGGRDIDELEKIFARDGIRTRQAAIPIIMDYVNQNRSRIRHFTVQEG